VNAIAAANMANAAKKVKQKLTVAHYRRAQPLFQKIKQLITDKAIGEIRFARLSLYKPSLTPADMKVEKTAWRIDPLYAGGGLFHDLSPHQIDLMYYFFGEPAKAMGIANNQAGLYNADDIVSGNILFKNGVQVAGTWCFGVSPDDDKDECEILGSNGKIIFSFFEHKPVTVIVNGKTETYRFDPLQHVQQPMIEKTVNYFLDDGPNPCSGEEGAQVMKLIDDFTNKKEQ
jgi:predicted dehydrogenase